MAMAASIAAVYPHMNHVGGDGFWLIREPSGRVRAHHGGRPRRREGDAAALSRRRPRRDPGARAARRAHRAGRSGGLDAGDRGGARRQGGRAAARCAVDAAIKHAREGYTVTRSQARLTVEKYAELETAPGFLQAFLVDGKPPEAGAQLKQSAFAATLDHLAQAGLDDFYRGDVGREIAADLERIGSPVTRADLEKFEARIAEPLSVRSRPARSTTRRRRRKGWPRSSSSRCSIACAFREAESFEHIHGLVEATKRAFRVRDRVVTDPDQIDARSQPISVAEIPRCRSREDRRQESRALAGARRAGRHHLDGRGGFLRPRRLLHPVALLGIRLRLRAAGDRRADAEPRRELFARSQGAQHAFARPPPVPHAQSGARRTEGRPRHRLRHHGRRRPAANASGRVHAPRHASASRSTRRSTRRAGCSAAPGVRPAPICGWNPVSTATSSTG